MKLTRIEGPARIHHCDGCAAEAVAGTEPYTSAASGELVEPAEWYESEDGTSGYCSTCAAKLVEEDPTRSVTQFYADTAGQEVLPENLPDV